MHVRLALTMRVTQLPGSSERRDAIAQDWTHFLAATLPGAAWLPLPNVGERVTELAEAFGVTGVVLTGGDDWGVYPERDATEAALFRWAMAQNLPVLGVCRGAQVVNRLLGGSVREGAVDGHAGVRHGLANRADWVPAEVNSYHHRVMTADTLAPSLECAGQAPDGTVEAFWLPCGRVTGIVWHPERENPYRACDVALLQRLFLRENA